MKKTRILFLLAVLCVSSVFAEIALNYNKSWKLLRYDVHPSGDFAPAFAARLNTELLNGNFKVIDSNDQVLGAFLRWNPSMIFDLLSEPDLELKDPIAMRAIISDETLHLELIPQTKADIAGETGPIPAVTLADLAQLEAEGANGEKLYKVVGLQTAHLRALIAAQKTAIFISDSDADDWRALHAPPSELDL